MNQGRVVVAKALGQAASVYPHLPPAALDVASLSEQDKQLALAVHRTALQRWITLEYLLDLHLRKPTHALEPALRGVLLSAAAQLVFFDRMPAHAVVDESVTLAKQLVRPGAGGLVNAVLRRLSLMTDCPLPPPGDKVNYLSITTSHGRPLVRNWIDVFGFDQAMALCRHGVCTPPIWVAPEFEKWDGAHDELVAFLAEDPRRRVQDPAAALPLGATETLRPRVIIDYCAGKGTKTRQAAVMHPQAQVLAHDIEPQLGDMHDLPNVDLLANHRDIQADLLILDVPCSNTAALARRPEAKYRYDKTTLESLIKLQRQIAKKAMPLAARGGHVLYCTCSLEPQENAQQTAWLAKQYGATVAIEKLTLPSGGAGAHRDGSYFALLCLT